MDKMVFELTRIVQAVAKSDSWSEQMTMIIESVTQLIAVDVCSLYMANAEQDMELVASHGLHADSVGHVKIPAGLGLVGLAVESRHPINIANAAEHPAFYYISETREERFKGFCAVPLVRAGRSVGVLVVQSLEPRRLADHEEAFLVTLAAQLALLSINQPLFKGSNAGKNLRLLGVKGAPGVAIAKSWLCEGVELGNAPDSVCEDAEATIAEWHQLLQSVLEEIEDEQKSLGDELSNSIVGIFTVYRMLLNDRSLTERVKAGIHSGKGLPEALRLAIQHFSDQFLAMEDPYLQARHEDILQLGNKLYNSWRGSEGYGSLPEGAIVLLGNHVSVSDIAKIPQEQLVGIICFEGSTLSHTAVLANAMGIPAVMGTGPIKSMHVGETLILDGNQGQVILNPGKKVRKEYQRLIDENKKFTKQFENLRDEPAVTTEGRQINLFTNTGLLADISPGLANGAEGVGLYRTEIPFMAHDGFPSEDEQFQIYRQVLKAYAGKPVYIRTLDIGSDKQLPYFPISNEDNPALGWRGIRFGLDNSSLLMTQLRAMIRAAEGGDHLHILLPIVSASNELDEFRELLNDACQQLRGEGITIKDPKVGVMVEVPAAISQLPFWVYKIDFISIGSNDLSQYLLALDRNNSRVSSRYDVLHPAVLHEIFRVVGSAQQLGLPVSLCGEMASDPAAIVLLIGMGIRTLSMSAAKLPQIKWLIRNLSARRAEELLQQVLTMDNAASIRNLLNSELKSMGMTGITN